MQIDFNNIYINYKSKYTINFLNYIIIFIIIRKNIIIDNYMFDCI